MTLAVRDPKIPGNLDHYRATGGELESVAPARVGAGTDLDDVTFAASEVAWDRVEAMVDTALAEFGAPDGHVARMSVLRHPRAGPVVELALESARAGATARFSATGELLEVGR